MINKESDTTNKSKAFNFPAKLACLSCRKKHLKCDGATTCKHCSAKGIECIYSASRRGGSRPKKLKTEYGFKVDRACQSTELTIVADYYNLLHLCHPILPSKTLIIGKISNGVDLEDLLKSMELSNRVMGGPRREITPEEFQELLTAFERTPRDLFKLQSLLIGYLVGKFSGFSSCESLKDQAIDILAGSVDSLLQSSRISPETENLTDSLHNTIQELYCIDIVMSASSGLISKMAEFNISHFELLNEPFYNRKIRFAAVELLKDLMAQKPLNEYRYNSLKLKLSVVESEVLKLDLVDTNGLIDEGVFFSVMVISFAKMALNQPFTKAGRICNTSEDILDDDDPYDLLNSEAEYLCVDGANNITGLIARIGINKSLQRTPLLSCSLIQSLIFYLRHYIWLSFSSENGLKSELLLNLTLGINFLALAKARWPFVSSLMNRFLTILNSRVPFLCESIAQCPYVSSESQTLIQGSEATTQQLPEDQFDDLDFDRLEQELFAFSN